MERCQSEVVDVLELRQRLKESIRNQRRMTSEECSRSCEEENKRNLPYDDNYGSFFGHSQSVISKRVIQDNKSASVLFDKNNENKVSKYALHNQLPIVNEVKIKKQKIKESRDYSFLYSDDPEHPAPAKEHPSLEAQPVNGGSVGGKLPPKAARSNNNKIASTMAPADSRKRLGNNIVKKIKDTTDYSFPLSDDARLTAIAKEPPSFEAQPASKQPLSSVNGGSVGSQLPPKARMSNKLSSTMASANSRKLLGNNSVKKSTISKAHSSMEQRKDNREIPKITPRKPVASSSAHKSKPPTHAPTQQCPKKRARPLYEDDDDQNLRAISIIREMFSYDPSKFADDDKDDIKMEAGFNDILKEERRSARIARREDAEQLRLTEEEERERKRRIAKSKQLKLSKH